MGESPRFGVRFKYRPTDEHLAVPSLHPRSERGAPGRHDRAQLYDLALVFSARVHAVLEHADAERYFLRDKLDRASASVPLLIAQGLARAEMAARRTLYDRARHALIDCAAILDVLIERATAPLDTVIPASALALALIDTLLPLTVPPPRIW